MVIINADDWGRSPAETDAALACYERGRITSVTAMVFMEDSARAAELANERRIDVGLHLNLTQRFSRPPADAALRDQHDRIARVLGASKYASLVYHPVLRDAFRSVYQAQRDEFVRLYGRQPSHIDGHHHQHLCANMLVDRIIAGGEKVRRSFHFWPDEKGWLNRTYRSAVDRWLRRNYTLADYFFALAHCLRGDRLARVVELARTATVEVMAHPVAVEEQAFLLGDAFAGSLGTLELGTYASIEGGASADESKRRSDGLARP
jgi:predicted glycoside hydrolase/deacetylase ChbG (UPF0249 family)